MTTVTTPLATTATTGLNLRRILKLGLLGGLGMVFITAIGMLAAFNRRLLITPILSLGYLVLFSLPFLIGHLMARRVEKEGVATAPRTSADVVAAAVAGGLAGFVAGLFAILVNAAPGLRGTLPNLSPALVEVLTLGMGVGIGLVLLTVLGAAVAALGAGFHWLPPRMARAVSVAAQSVVAVAVFEAVIDDLFDWFKTIPNFLYASRGGLTILSAIVVFLVAGGLAYFLPGRIPSLRSALMVEDESKRRRNSLIAAVVVTLIVLVIPQFLGGVLNELLTNVGLFLLMGLGLNIVVGHAGLLDLGYVAFFAVGAYTTAVLTSPLSPFFAPEMSWWQAFPLVLIAAAIAGILVGTPVIRMRGDYLAIVTLGFGEIVRLLLLSDWLSPYFGGSQGIRRIPGIGVGGSEIGGTSINLFVYFTLALVAVAAYISWRLEDSRVGRAWAALREDEDVAEAVGVDTVKAKLQAFVTGAILASFAGALFSAKVGSVFTNSFEILVSIVILVVVIVGGMGNIAGVAVGALVLIGVLGGPNQPGLLQEFGEFKLLIYGALLVYMMLQRPEGLLPSARRAQELHQEEFLQDAWLDKGGQLAETAPKGA
jgi:branched-chain amino acid transport system permease protein